MSRAIETVAVVGRDAPAWIAAAALHRAVGKAGIKVQVVELASLLSPVDVYAALPSIRGLHQLLGLDEAMVLAAADGVPMVAQRFSNWSGAAPPFVHGYDDAPPPGGDLDFVHYWAKGRLEGLKVPFEDFSLAATMAKQGRVPALADQDPALSATFGVQLDARRYSRLLKHVALHLGIAVTSGSIRDVERDGDRITAVVLTDGERVEADLFIDASGTEAALISKLAGAEFEPWSEWLPCNRMLSASAPALQPLPAFSQVSAFRGGWIALHPLRQRTAIVAVYDTQRISDQEMVETLPILTRMPIAGDAVVSPLRLGAQKCPWIGNCVAVGEAAVSLEPLDAVQLHLTHMCVSHLVTLFPVSADELPEAAAYSTSIRSLAANLRDFQCAHYKLNRRFDEPLWDRARDAAVPDSLHRKLDLFDSRGHVLVFDHETFEALNWAQIFVGHGLLPKGYDPRIDRLPDEQHIAKVQKRMKDVASLVRAAPTVEAFLATAAPPQELVTSDA